MIKYILIIPWLIYGFYRTKNVLHMLQQNTYDLKHRYIKWLYKNFDKYMLKLDLIQLPLILVLIFNKNELLSYISFFLIYLILSINIYIKNANTKIKLPLKITARIKRLIISLLFIYTIIIFVLIKIFSIELLLILSIMIYFQYFILLFIQKINIPIEKIVYYSFKNKASKKLQNYTNLNVVGITGSYGKTSSKNILNDILNMKYNSKETPKNFNTPFGLMISINEYLDKFDDIFIAEMGACKKGDIKELCDLVHPKYGIITTIGTAHLETFITKENIRDTKFELIESLPRDGAAILNADDVMQVEYKIKGPCKKIWISINNMKADFIASNIVTTADGTSFDVLIQDLNQKYSFETKLLGNANIYNILAGIALGYELGIQVNDLITAVKKVKPVEHRLEIKKVNDITYIDDAYNSNPVGAKMALDVLNLMSGKKIIITPGMIDLGNMQYELNKEFGKQISKVCDDVILIGEVQTRPIYDGLIEEGYDKSKIWILDTIDEAFILINKLKGSETFVLLENDLPDIFN